MVIISNRRLTQDLMTGKPSGDNIKQKAEQDLMTGKPSGDNIKQKAETRPYDR